MKIYKVFLIAIMSAITFYSCNNDDDNNTQTCTTQGLFYTLGNNATVTAPESNLTTDLFPNNTIVGGQSIPSVEIFGTDSNGDFIVFTTEILTVNGTGTGNLSIGSGNVEMISVTCLATDSTVGGLMRFQISGTYNSQTISGEFCVTIDSVNP